MGCAQGGGGGDWGVGRGELGQFFVLLPVWTSCGFKRDLYFSRLAPAFLVPVNEFVDVENLVQHGGAGERPCFGKLHLLLGDLRIPRGRLKSLIFKTSVRITAWRRSVEASEFYRREGWLRRTD